MEDNSITYTDLEVAHRLSALQLLGITPLIRYKNISSDFELFIPKVYADENSREQESTRVKSPINAKAFFVDNDKSVESKRKNFDTLQNLFSSLAENAREVDKNCLELREKQVTNENLATHPKLNLHIWHTENKFLILSDCTFKNTTEYRNAEKLLLNIFKALQLNWYLLGYYQFHLPDKNIPAPLLEALSWEDLAQKLELYLKGSIFETIQPLNGIILFSDNNLQQIRKILNAKFNLYLGAPSLKALLTKPMQKQLFWQKILNENWHEKLTAQAYKNADEKK